MPRSNAILLFTTYVVFRGARHCKEYAFDIRKDTKSDTKSKSIGRNPVIHAAVLYLFVFVGTSVASVFGAVGAWAFWQDLLYVFSNPSRRKETIVFKIKMVGHSRAGGVPALIRVSLMAFGS